MSAILVKSFVGQAEKYFEEELTNERETYYSEKGSNIGQWTGKGAEALGLRGDIKKENFAQMSRGINPATGERFRRMTLGRTREVNGELKRVKEIAGWDFVISAPKSVSTAAIIGGDKRVREAHEQSVTDALERAEQQAQANLGGGKKEQTNNLTIGRFKHDSARPSRDGFVAPQLHDHCYIMNATFRADGTLKPLESSELHKAQSYIRSIYYTGLADRLQRLGYEIEIDHETGAPEITGISKEYRKACSPRRTEILELAAKAGRNYRQLGLVNRREKIFDRDLIQKQHRGIDGLFDYQAQRVVQAATKNPRPAGGNAVRIAEKATQVVTSALAKISAREAVFNPRVVLLEANKHGVGQTTVAAIEAEFETRKKEGQIKIVRLGDGRAAAFLSADRKTERQHEPPLIEVLRPKETLKAEFYRSLSPTEQVLLEKEFAELAFEQKELVVDILDAETGVTILEGRAGIVKTKTLSIINKIAEKAEYEVLGVSPLGGGAAQELGKAGIKGATLQELLASKDTPREQRRFFIIDESSFVSSRQMDKFFREAVKPGDRVLLAGDTHQRREAEAEKPLAQSEDKQLGDGAKVVVSRRQSKEAARATIENLPEEKIAEAVEAMRQRRQVVEIKDRHDRHAAIVKTFTEQPKQNLVVAPREADRREINRKIHQSLKDAGKIGPEEIEIKILRPRNELSGTERASAAAYQQGDVIIYTRGSAENKIAAKNPARVIATDRERNLLTVKIKDIRGGTEAREIIYNPKRLRGVSVWTEEKIRVSAGDRLQFCAPFEEKKTKIASGTMLEVGKITTDALNLTTDKGKTLKLDADQPYAIDYGYAVTSQSSQGKTIDRILVHAETSESKQILSERMAYVAVSRMRDEALVFTDNAEQLVEKMAQTVEEGTITTAIVEPIEYTPPIEEIEQSTLPPFVQRSPMPKTEIPAVQQRIARLQEIKDERRALNFASIEQEIVVSDKELKEKHKLGALAQKLNYPDKPIFATSQTEEQNSFQTQAAILRDKPLSEYWWKMKAETDEKGQVTVNPAAFEFLRVAYKATFQKDVDSFENTFNKAETADRFVQTLVYKEESGDIYRESLASLNKTIAEGRQAHGNGSLIILTGGKSASRQPIHPSVNSSSSETHLIEQKQPDKTYAEFQSIFKQAGLEKILESKSGRASLEIVGDNTARYEIIFSADEIKFFDVKDTDDKIDPTVKNRSITFRKNEAGDYHPAASVVIPDDLNPEAVVRYIRDDAVEKIGLLKTSELGKNIIVTRLDIENDSRAEIEEINRANLEKYVSRQLGRELVAEIGARTARYNETAFRDNADDERLKVITDIGRGEETREISRADLLREREAIARSNVNNAREQGTLEGMVEDEGISIEAVEKRQYSRAIIKTQTMQKPWIDALDKAIASETTRLEKATVQADLQMEAEKVETASIIKQTQIEDTKQIKPALSPEKTWTEQIKAVKRFDTDTFVKLEEIHQASNLPRPNDVYARLRGMETVVKMNVRRENVNLVERFGKKTTEQNIVVNLRRESGELKLEAWRVEKTEQSPLQLTKEIQAGNAEIKAEQTSLLINAPRPLTDKINSALPTKIDLSWIADNKKTLNAYLNPVGVIKNDEGLQIIRAVAGYIDQKSKNEQLADLTERTLNAAQTLKADSTSEAHDNAARLSQAVQTAVQREEAMRENLRLDESINTELLKTPERGFREAEMKQIGVIAAEIGDIQEVKEYYDLVKKDVEFAGAVGETEERISTKFFLAEVRAVQQSNNAIEQITPLPDGSINVELNPAQLTHAIDSFRTADAFEEFQPAASSEKSIIRSLSLEDIRQTEQFLAANNQISDPLNNQIFIAGNDLMKNLQPPMSQTEQQIFKELTISQETQSRFAEISQSERFLDDMERQAEVAAQNQIPFEQTARNFTFVNPSDEAEAKEMKFWQNDRRQREAEIVRENAQKRSVMTDDEKAEQDAIALDEAVKDESAQEQEREGSAQVL